MQVIAVSRLCGPVARLCVEASALAACGLDLLGADVDVGGLDAEGVGDLDDAGEAGVALSALHAAVVGAVDAALERECLLGDAALLP